MKQRVHKLLVSLFEEVGGRFVTDQQLEPIYDQWVKEIANVPYKDFKHEIIKMQGLRNLARTSPTYERLIFALNETIGHRIAVVRGTMMIVPDQYNTAMRSGQQPDIKPIGPVTEQHLDKAEQYILQTMQIGAWPMLSVYGVDNKVRYGEIQNIALEVGTLLEPIKSQLGFLSDGILITPIRDYLRLSGNFQTAKSKILDQSLRNQEFDMNDANFEGETLDYHTVDDESVDQLIGAWEEAETDYWADELIIDGLTQTDFPFDGIKYVDYLELNNTELANLGTLQFAESSVEIYNAPNFKTLAPLAYVKESLLVSGKSSLQTLGVIAAIGADLEVNNIQTFKSLGTLRQVGGNINASDTSLEDLGHLKDINGSLDCERTNLHDLGQLETVKGYVNLSDTRYLETLGQLESVGQSLDLENSAVRDIGTLHTVGGDVVITGTSLTPQAFANVKIGGEIIQ